MCSSNTGRGTVSGVHNAAAVARAGSGGRRQRHQQCQRHAAASPPQALHAPSRAPPLQQQMLVLHLLLIFILQYLYFMPCMCICIHIYRYFAKVHNIFTEHPMNKPKHLYQLFSCLCKFYIFFLVIVVTNPCVHCTNAKFLHYYYFN